MSRYLAYSPDQGSLLPPSVEAVLGRDHLCFFVHQMVERLDLKRFLESYAAEGGVLYHPSLLLKLWLYAYAVGITSSRRLEQRVREDLALRYLAGGAEPDYWALNAFRRRHGRALNDSFTQVVEQARELGLRQLGTVAVDATRIKASASPDKVVAVERAARARVRRRVRSWQQACDGDDPNQGAGSHVGAAIEQIGAVSAELKPLPRPARSATVKCAATVERATAADHTAIAQRAAPVKRSLTDADARFLRSRGGRFVLGYTAEVAVTEDHLIVAQRVTQAGNENDSLPAMIALVAANCGTPPARVVADSGYYSNRNLEPLAHAGIDVYVPDSNLARELNLGQPASERHCRDPHQQAMRAKLRSDEGRRIYTRRKGIVEPVFGVLKQQRGLGAGFRLRSLDKVAIEFALAATAYNLTRLHKLR